MKVSLAVDPGPISGTVHPALDLPIEVLQTGEGPGSGGLDERHVPLLMEGGVYEVVDEARRRVAAWTAFASTLESRTR